MINHVLFIDDDEDILNFYKLIVDKNNNSVPKGLNEQFASSNNYFISPIYCEQGDIALSKLSNRPKENPIKVAFIDISMPPGENGIETAKKIRRISPEIEIVIVTGNNHKHIRKISNEIGNTSKLLFLKKPFVEDEALQMIKNLCLKFDLETVKDELVTNVSHELKTPLSCLLGFTNLLIEDKTTTQEQRETLKLILKNAQNMGSLVDGLISTMEIEGDLLQVKSNNINSRDLIENIYQTSRPLISQNKDLSIYIDTKSENFNFHSDETKLKQCLTNLISNAAKFTDKGEISLVAKKKKKDILLTVSDTGIGIEQDKIKDVFNPFMRVENSHHLLPGLGLGLSLCKNLVNLIGGEIEVKSLAGKGSSFTILLPNSYTAPKTL
jgi:signal transduction histidine kinase